MSEGLSSEGKTMIELGNFWTFVCLNSLDVFEWSKLLVHAHTDNYIFMVATPWTPHNWLEGILQLVEGTGYIYLDILDSNACT